MNPLLCQLSYASDVIEKEVKVKPGFLQVAIRIGLK